MSMNPYTAIQIRLNQGRDMRCHLDDDRVLSKKIRGAIESSGSNPLAQTYHLIQSILLNIQAKDNEG